MSGKLKLFMFQVLCFVVHWPLHMEHNFLARSFLILGRQSNLPKAEK